MKNKKIQLNLGCGIHLVKDFINIDKVITLKDLKDGIETKKGLFRNAIIEKGSEFIQCDMKELPFKDNSVDYIECCEAIEHVPMNEVIIVIKEMHRVLKTGHKAVIFTTNFADLSRLYLEESDKEDFDMQRFYEISAHIYGNQLTEGEFHRSAFSPWLFKRMSDVVGFKDIKVVMHPRYTSTPKLKAFRPMKDGVLVCDFLLATLTK